MKTYLCILCVLLINSNNNWQVHAAASYKARPETYSPPYYYAGYKDGLGMMSGEYMSLMMQQSNAHIQNLLYAAFLIQNQGIKYNLKAKKLHDSAINCTGLVKYLFTSAGLSYGSQVMGSKDIHKTTYSSATDRRISSEALYVESSAVKSIGGPLYSLIQDIFPKEEERAKSSVTDFFQLYSLDQYKKNTGHSKFRPQAGDVLVYYKNAKREGHAVVVIDPKNCVAIDSSRYTFIEGTRGRIPSMEGVYFRYLKSPSCDPVTGEWISWGKKANQFQVLMRHKAFQPQEFSKENKPMFAAIN